MAKINFNSLSLSDVVRDLHNNHGTPDDEPIRVIHMKMAESIDRMEGLQAKFGPDAARQAAEGAAYAANRAVSDGVKKVAWQLSAIRGVATMLLCAMFACGGWTLRAAMDAETQIGPMPRDLASLMHMQDWNLQWPMCQKQKPINNVEWCYMPIITKSPNINEKMVAR